MQLVLTVEVLPYGGTTAEHIVEDLTQAIKSGEIVYIGTQVGTHPVRLHHENGVKQDALPEL